MLKLSDEEIVSGFESTRRMEVGIEQLLKDNWLSMVNFGVVRLQLLNFMDYNDFVQVTS